MGTSVFPVLLAGLIGLQSPATGGSQDSTRRYTPDEVRVACDRAQSNQPRLDTLISDTAKRNALKLFCSWRIPGGTGDPTWEVTELVQAIRQLTFRDATIRSVAHDTGSVWREGALEAAQGATSRGGPATIPDATGMSSVLWGTTEFVAARAQEEVITWAADRASTVVCKYPGWLVEACRYLRDKTAVAGGMGKAWLAGLIAAATHDLARAPSWFARASFDSALKSDSARSPDDSAHLGSLASLALLSEFTMQARSGELGKAVQSVSSLTSPPMQLYVRACRAGPCRVSRLLLDLSKAWSSSGYSPLRDYLRAAILDSESIAGITLTPGQHEWPSEARTLLAGLSRVADLMDAAADLASRPPNYVVSVEQQDRELRDRRLQLAAYATNLIQAVMVSLGDTEPADTAVAGALGAMAQALASADFAATIGPLRRLLSAESTAACAVPSAPSKSDDGLNAGKTDPISAAVVGYQVPPEPPAAGSTLLGRQPSPRDAKECHAPASPSCWQAEPSWAALLLVADLAQARSDTDVRDALERYASPPTMYLAKRTSGVSYYGVNAYFGAQAGEEWNVGTPAAAAGLFVPVGFEVRLGTSTSKSLFFSLADLGALASWRTGGGDIATRPNVGLAQVVSPGMFLVSALGRSPFSLGLGAALTPQLRAVGADQSQHRTVIRAFLFGAVDVPLLGFASYVRQ